MFGISLHTMLPKLVLLVSAMVLYAGYTNAQGAVWRAWSDFSECTVSCGGGVQDRTRTCNVIDDGAECDGPGNDFQFCNFDKCPVDGVWTDYGPWTICSVSCGGGVHTRSRECIGPEAGGSDCVGDPEDTQSCSMVPCPVDGMWSTWTAYSPCSATCGGGVRSRTRMCNSPSPMNGGAVCIGEDTHHATCNLQECPHNTMVHGSWGPWALLSPCSTTCEAGTQSRVRSCSNPLPANGGDQCDGNTIQQLSCNLGECPIDGGWGEWSNFSACSVSCGGGIKQQFRFCDDPAPEHGGTVCSTTPLPENVTDVTGQEGLKQAFTEMCNPDDCQPINGSWSEWSGLYRCSVTCGDGVQRRMRTCNDPPAQNGGLACEPTEPANTTVDGVVIEFKTFPCVTGVPCPVHGEWNTWTSWSTCDVTCGTGSQTRTRTCSDPSHGGVGCEGDGTETQDCTMPVCNIDGGWTPWSSWTDCSATCGNGTRTQTRTCTNPPPSGNGANCTGSTEDGELCNTQACPPMAGGWSHWSVWTSCSEPCDKNGIRTRIRSCDNPEPERGGTDCVGTRLMSKPCDDVQACIGPYQDGSWGLWGSWTQCSAECGIGERVRTRDCDTPHPSKWGIPCIRARNKGPLYYPPEYLSVECERQLCNTQPCSVDGAWGLWSPWSTCPKTCGGGMKSRERKCNNPRPQHGGRHCPDVSPYLDSDSQAKACNTMECPLDDDLTTATPLSTTTLTKKFCPKIRAHDGLEWPRTEVGTTVQIQCPTPSVGPTFRKCESENRWGNIDTTKCIREDLEELDQMATYASKHAENMTALKSAVNLAFTKCTAESIQVSGQLMTCLRVIIKLAERGIPMEPLLEERDKKNLYYLVLTSCDEILSPILKPLWDSITKSDFHDDINPLSELPNSILTMAKDMALYKQKTRGTSFIQVKDNIEAAVDVVSCDTTIDYRFPYKPPDPTPPSKHIRGGWTPPPEPHLTYGTIRQGAFLDRNCIFNRRKRQSGNLLSDLTNMTQMAEQPTKYPVTLVFHSLPDLLPDINKMPYVAPPKDPGSEYIPIEDIHIVNSKVVSMALVGKTEALNESMTITIRFYYNKEGRDHICASLDTQKRNMEYDPSMCNLTKTTVNYTDCECQLSAGTFVLLMRPGVIRDNVTYVVTPDVFLEYGCYIGVAVHAIAIILLLIIGLWDVDRHWIVINFCLSTVIYQLFTVVGQRWVNEDNMCYFMSWLVHYAAMVNMSWVMGLMALQFKQTYNNRPLRFLHRIYYALICWLIPCFIAIIPAGLRHGYVIRKYFCWLSPEEHTDLAFFIPVVVIAVVALVILSITVHISRAPPSKMDLEELLGHDRATKKRFHKALFFFIFIVLLTLLMLGLNIGVAFLLANIAQCLFVAMIFVILNEDVQEGYGSKKQGIEEYIRLKKEQQEGPDLQTGRNEGDPDWVQQTRTAPMLTVDLSNNYNQQRRLAPIHESLQMEESREARRERRRQKRLAAQKPVYVARSEGQGHSYANNPRAAAYRAAPTPVRTTPAQQPEAVPLSQPAIRRPRRTKSRQMTKNMTSQ